MSRFSSLITDELVKDADFQEVENRFETQKGMDVLQQRASMIIHLLMGSKDFMQTYLCNGAEDLHLFSHISKRLIVINALTRCTADQVANFDTYKFTAHPIFEKKISSYTRSVDKPNPHLSKCRAWDIGLDVVIKAEALDSEMARQPNSRLLFREFNILKFIWECYLRENMDLDEITGIPMVFDYTELPNSEFNYEPKVEYKVVDIHGGLVPWKSDNETTLSYMSMEKLGPTIQYLQELMVHTKRRTRTFNLETAFKVFDQLICRCLQLHRFGVVHNVVEPRNIYFGRSIAFNVVYLGNYSKAMIMDSKDRKVADVFMGGDPRYSSQYQTRGSHINPMQDIESAFYTLLSMIVSNLPWDIYLLKNDSTPRHSENQNTSNQDPLEAIDSHPKVREIKSGFWKSLAGINRMLADVRYLTIGSDAVHVNLATEIIKDLYSKLRDQFQAVGSRPKVNIVNNLMSQQTSEYQFYVDLRRTTLMFFRFESLSVSLCTPTYQKKIEAISRDEQEPRPAWNISNWCFNVVQMNAPGNMRLSMIPVDAGARMTG